MAPASNKTVSRRDCLRGGVTLAAGALVAGCGSSSGARTTTSSASPAGRPRRGGTLRTAFTGGTSADNLNPNQAIQNLDFIRVANLYDPLVQLTPEGTAELVLAEEITPNSQATEWTIRIHQGVEFHNGKELTSEDVVWTLHSILNPKAPGWQASFFTPMDNNAITALDKYTVRIGCLRPFSILVEALSCSGASCILPVGWTESNPVGTGPFKFKSFTPGYQSTFTRNPNYWQSALPYVDELIIVDYADETTQVNALLSDSTDIIAPLSYASIAALKPAGMHVLAGNSYEQIMFTMRVDMPPFNDVRVRQALRYVVDRPAMLETVFGGYGTLGNDILGIGAPEYDNALPQRGQDIGLAKSLLKAAGQENLSVQLVTGNITQGTLSMAEVLAEQASAAGVRINLKQVTSTVLYGPDYLKWLFAQDYSYYAYLFPAIGQFLIPGGPFNETHFDDPQLNALFNEGMSTLNVAKRNDIGHEICRIQYDSGAYIIPVTPPLISAANPKVQGLYSGVNGVTPNYGSFARVWIR